MSAVQFEEALASDVLATNVPSMLESSTSKSCQPKQEHRYSGVVSWAIALIRLFTTFAAILGVVVGLCLFALMLLGLKGDAGFFAMVTVAFIACLIVILVNLRAMKPKQQLKSNEKLK
jgi:hypothetical protein